MKGNFEKLAVMEEDEEAPIKPAQTKTGKGVRKTSGIHGEISKNTLKHDRKTLLKYRDGINDSRELNNAVAIEKGELEVHDNEQEIMSSTAHAKRDRQTKEAVHRITTSIAQAAESKQRIPEEEREIEQALASGAKRLDRSTTVAADKIATSIERNTHNNAYDQGKREIGANREYITGQANAKAYFAERKARKMQGENVIDVSGDQVLGEERNKQDRIEVVRRDLGVASSPRQEAEPEKTAEKVKTTWADDVETGLSSPEQLKQVSAKETRPLGILGRWGKKLRGLLPQRILQEEQSHEEDENIAA